MKLLSGAMVLASLSVAKRTMPTSIPIALVAAGMGPESLAWGLVASAAINGVVSMAVRPHPVLPNLSPAELRRVFSVGGPATVIAVIEDIVGSLPELVLGRMQGLAATGLFSRG